MIHVLRSNGREDLIQKLVPEFPVGCKRIGVSDNYLQAFCLPNVTVNCSPIKITRGRIISTTDGVDTEVGTLVLATGFNIVGFLGEMQVFGQNKLSLNQLWQEQTPRTYKTEAIHGFPNFFMMLGPGSGLGHNSVVTNIEL